MTTFEPHVPRPVGMLVRGFYGRIFVRMRFNRAGHPPTERYMSQARDTLDFAKSDGLIPAIAQDAATGDVLMLAYMNEESYAETLRTGHAVYWSRSRQKLWRKGEESGNVQIVHEILIDCDADTIVLKVEQVGGAACHTGHRSCFYRKVTPDGLVEIAERVFDPDKVYKKN